MRSTLQASNRSPLNSSKSKAMFTFSKGDRFPNLSSESKYFIFHSAHFSMKNKRLSAKEPRHSAMEIKLISHCKIHLIQQKEFSFAWQIHHNFWLSMFPQKRTYNWCWQRRLQICIDLQPNCQSWSRKLQYSQRKCEGYDHEFQAKIPITLGQ